MPRKKIACAVCGEFMSPGSKSLPEGQAKHNRCRVTHGEARYRRHGCRCRECKSAVAKVQRKFRKAYKERTGVEYRSLFSDDNRWWINPLQRNAIYVRDNWVCQICRKPVGKTLDHATDPMGATLDHITPQSWADEPDHSPSNLRLAHRVCNSARGNRVEI